MHSVTTGAAVQRAGSIHTRDPTGSLPGQGCTSTDISWCSLAPRTNCHHLWLPALPAAARLCLCHVLSPPYFHAGVEKFGRCPAWQNPPLAGIAQQALHVPRAALHHAPWMHWGRVEAVSTKATLLWGVQRWAGVGPKQKMEAAVTCLECCVFYYPLWACCSFQEQEENTGRARLLENISSQHSSDLQKGSEVSLSAEIQALINISKILAFGDRWLCLC